MRKIIRVITDSIVNKLSGTKCIIIYAYINLLTSLLWNCEIINKDLTQYIIVFVPINITLHVHIK